MRIIKPGIALTTIIVLVSVVSQVALADSHPPGRMVVVLVDRPAIAASEDGVGLVRSFLGLMSSLAYERPFAFAYADEPETFTGPVAPAETGFATTRVLFEDELRYPGPEGRSRLTGALVSAFELLEEQDAVPGSTVYLITGDASAMDLNEESGRLLPVASIFGDKGWPIVGLTLPDTAADLRDLVAGMSEASRGEAVELSVPGGFKRVADMVLRDDARGSLEALTQGPVASNAVFTSALDMAPGTLEAVLLFFKEGPYTSLRLTNPSGFEASFGDRTSSTVVETPYVVAWRLVDPAPGRWTVDVRGTDGTVSAWHYAVNKYRLSLESFGVVPVDEATTIVSALTDGSGPVSLDDVEVTATITAPDGTTVVHVLRDDGASEDSVAGDGYYAASIPPLPLSGDYRVELGLNWPEYGHGVSSPAVFEAQPFPRIEVTSLATEELELGLRHKVATVSVLVAGQPYAVPTDQLSWELASNIEQSGTLDIVPRRIVGQGRAWEYDVYFAPEAGGFQTLVVRIDVEYAGRRFSHTSESLVLSAPMPPVELLSPAKPVAEAPPPSLPEQDAPVEPIVIEPSAFPWGLTAGLLAAALLAAVAGLYWYTRQPPYGYLYDESKDMLVDFGRLKRRPIMGLLFRSLVKGDETGVAGLEDVRFSFFRDRVGMSIRPEAATVRVNNQPVVGETTVRDRTWIGTGGRLYSFLFSAEQPGLDLASADD
jgi:hypothetical protein